jgi:hypothetical protein
MCPSHIYIHTCTYIHTQMHTYTQVSLVMMDSGVPLPWDLTLELASHVAKIRHVSATCRLAPVEELQVRICMHVCTYVYIHIYIQNSQKDTRTHTHVSIHAYVHIYIRNSKKDTHRHGYSREGRNIIHTYSHTYIQLLKSESVVLHETSPE